MALFIPIAIQVARWAATRYIIRAAATRAATAGVTRVAATSAANPFTNPALRAYLPAAPVRLQQSLLGGVRIGGAPAAPSVNPEALWSLARTGPIQRTVEVANRLPLWARTGQAIGRGKAFIHSRPLGAAARAVAPNASLRFAKPTASLSQRVAAKPTIPGKIGTVAFAPVRATARGVNAMAVPTAVGGAELGLYNFGTGLALSGQRNREQDRQAAIASGVNYEGAEAETPDFTMRWGAPYAEGIPDTYQGPLGPDLFGLEDIGPAPVDVPQVTPPASTPGMPEAVEPGARPTPTIPVTPEASADAEFQRAREDYERDLAGLNAGYQNMLNQVRSMYQLSETEEEKQQLRFTLADLEAQFEAGREAIANLYVEKTQTIQTLAAASRVRAGEAANEASGLYSQAAVDLAALQEADNAAQIAANRGLGIGTIRQSPYAGLLETMAPIAGQYAQRVGDISAEGLEYLGALNESMGAARQGELQSLYAGSTATAGSDHARRVAERIAGERLAMASAVQSIMGQQLSMQQSMAGRRPDASSFDRTGDASSRNTRIEQIATSQFNNPQNFANQFAMEYGRAPTAEEWALFESYAQYYREQDTYARAIQEAELANLQATNSQRAEEMLYDLLPEGIPRTADALREFGILPSN